MQPAAQNLIINNSPYVTNEKENVAYMAQNEEIEHTITLKKPRMRSLSKPNLEIKGNDPSRGKKKFY